MKPKAEKALSILSAGGVLRVVERKKVERAENVKDESEDEQSDEPMGSAQTKSMQDMKGLVQKHYWTKEEVTQCLYNAYLG